MFSGQDQSKSNECLAQLMTELYDCKLIGLELEAIGTSVQPSPSLQDFFFNASYLRHIDISGTALGPLVGKQMGETMAKNREMKLKSFRAANCKLKDEDFAALSVVFFQQQSLVTLDISRNQCKRAMAPLLKAMAHCSSSIKHLNISYNKSINKAIPDLALAVRTCTFLEFLDISGLKIRKINVPEVTEALVEAIKVSACFKHLYWNKDLRISNSLAKQFLVRLSEVPATTTLLEVKLSGVF